MAFNLNKNDGSGEPPKSKFDLTKNDGPLIVVEEQPRKSKSLVFVIIGVLLVAIGSWYFLSNKTPDTLRDEGVQSAQSEPSISPADLKANSVATSANNTDTIAGATPTSIESPASVVSAVGQAAAVLNHKIPVSFARGNTSLRSIDQPMVRDLIKYLSDNPSARLEVRGYASSEGASPVNQVISQARADAFKSYLISKNVSEDRITALGKGIADPIAANDTESERRKNRRVEITLK